jgi:hypothetical protein
MVYPHNFYIRPTDKLPTEVATPSTAKQGAPVPNGSPSIQSLVRDDLETRERFGIAKYGTALQPNNGRTGITDAYQEALDLVCYIRQVIEEGGLVGRHGVDDTPHDELADGITPGQLLARILDGNTAQRLKLCRKFLNDSRSSNLCFMHDHTERIDALKQKVHELSKALVKCANGQPPSPDTVRIAESDAQQVSRF